MADHEKPADKAEVGPLGTIWETLPRNALSGFLVFLIALPLCLAIAKASGYPVLAGIFTAIAGGILVPLFSNSELTIKGPAAGLIAVAVACVAAFPLLGPDGNPIIGPDGKTLPDYGAVFAVGVCAGILQIIFALCGAGKLVDFFPTSTVHGMLAAIGIIIILKMIPNIVGISPSPEAGKELWRLVIELPHIVMSFNPAITIIGVTSLVIIFGWSFVTHPTLKLIPGPLLVLLVAVPLGIYFQLDAKQEWTWGSFAYAIDPAKMLVDVKPEPFSMFKEFHFPDFTKILNFAGVQYVLMFALVGSLETLLSSQAVDLLDPWHRKTDQSRDLLMVGIVNTAVSAIGGLPMISEIVRSRANIDAGATHRSSNMFHGVYLLAFVALLPFVVHKIPIAALAAMLIYTGFRLASPQEFVNTFLIGWEQLVIFLSTIIVTLASDLLLGIAAGIAVKMMIHFYHGVPLRSLFLPVLDITKLDEHKYLVEAKDSAVFTNWLAFKHQLMELGLIQNNNIVLDMSGTVLVDHTVMENLHTLEREFELNNLTLQVIGFDDHEAISGHKASARYKSAAKVAESIKAKEKNKPSRA